MQCLGDEPNTFTLPAALERSVDMEGGDDTLVLTAGVSVPAGLFVDGAAGTDTIALQDRGDLDLGLLGADATLRNFEQVDIAAAGRQVTLRGAGVIDILGGDENDQLVLASDTALTGDIALGDGADTLTILRGAAVEGAGALGDGDDVATVNILTSALSGGLDAGPGADTLRHDASVSFQSGRPGPLTGAAPPSALSDAAAARLAETEPFYLPDPDAPGPNAPLAVDLASVESRYTNFETLELSGAAAIEGGSELTLRLRGDPDVYLDLRASSGVAGVELDAAAENTVVIASGFAPTGRIDAGGRDPSGGDHLVFDGEGSFGIASVEPAGQTDAEALYAGFDGLAKTGAGTLTLDENPFNAFA
ncbi:MAG: hypothetical protein MI723_02535, partial [Caulobacterales bacterium]|nr:hypothetical protein [Caulobacterales bacterium]